VSFHVIQSRSAQPAQPRRLWDYTSGESILLIKILVPIGAFFFLLLWFSLVCSVRCTRTTRILCVVPLLKLVWFVVHRLFKLLLELLLLVSRMRGAEDSQAHTTHHQVVPISFPRTVPSQRWLQSPLGWRHDLACAFTEPKSAWLCNQTGPTELLSRRRSRRRQASMCGRAQNLSAAKGRCAENPGPSRTGKTPLQPSHVLDREGGCRGSGSKEEGRN
jgi:hypothetical protein